MDNVFLLLFLLALLLSLLFLDCFFYFLFNIVIFYLKEEYAVKVNAENLIHGFKNKRVDFLCFEDILTAVFKTDCKGVILKLSLSSCEKAVNYACFLFYILEY